MSLGLKGKVVLRQVEKRREQEGERGHRREGEREEGREDGWIVSKWDELSPEVSWNASSTGIALPPSASISWSIG